MRESSAYRHRFILQWMMLENKQNANASTQAISCELNFRFFFFHSQSNQLRFFRIFDFLFRQDWFSFQTNQFM